MWSLILFFLPVTFAKEPGLDDRLPLLIQNEAEPHEVRPIRAEPERAPFAQPNWSELSEREFKAAMGKLAEEIESASNGARSSEHTLKTLVKLLSASDTPSQVRKLAAEGLVQIAASRQNLKNWEEIIRIAITNPQCAGETRAIIAKAFRWEPLKPEQVEFIKKYLDDPKHRDAAISFLVGLEGRAKPLMDAIRPRLNEDYNAQRVLSHVGGEEAQRFFKKRLDPDGVVDPDTVKAFTDKPLHTDEELQLLTPLLAKKSLGLPARVQVFTAVLRSATPGSAVDQLEKFIEEALENGDEDLILALDEKILPMILNRGNLSQDRIIKIFAKRLPGEKDPLKKAVILNHLNAFLKNYWRGAMNDKEFLSYLERAAQSSEGKPKKEEFVASLARLQLKGGADFPKLDARLSEYLKTTPNKQRAANQLSKIDWELLSILPETAKLFLASYDRKGLKETESRNLNTLDDIHELYALAKTNNGELEPAKKSELTPALELLSSFTHRHPSALTDETVLTLAYHGRLHKARYGRLSELLESNDRKVAERAFNIAASSPTFQHLVKDNLLDNALRSNDPAITDSAIDLLVAQENVEKLTELIKSPNEKTRTAAFKKAAPFYDILSKLPRESASQFLESSDIEAAKYATRRLMSADQPLTEQELAQIIANIPRNAALATISIWALNEKQQQLKEVPAEVLKNLSSKSDHFVTLNLIKQMGKRAGNAVPELIKLVEPQEFDPDVGKALVAIGEPAKVALPKLQELMRNGNDREKIHAALTLQSFGVDMSGAVPEARKLLNTSTDSDMIIAAGELLIKLPGYRDEGLRRLIYLRGGGSGMIDAKIKELWNDDVSKSVRQLLGDSDVEIANSAKLYLEQHVYPIERDEK